MGANNARNGQQRGRTEARLSRPHAHAHALRSRSDLTDREVAEIAPRLCSSACGAAEQERLEAERKAREEAAKDVIFGLESVFADPLPEPDAAEPEPAP